MKIIKNAYEILRMQNAILLRVIVMILYMQVSVYVEAQMVFDTKTGVATAATMRSAPLRSVRQMGLITNVTYEINGLTMCSSPSSVGEYMFQLDGFGVNDVEGEPAYLVTSDRFFIPDGYCASLNIVACEFNEYDRTLSPASIPTPDSGVQDVYVPKPISPYNGLFPKEFVKLGATENYRGASIQYVDVTPVLYDYRNKTIKVLTKISYNISMSRVATSLNNTTKMNIFDDDIIANMVVNDELVKNIYIANRDNLKEYLIVTTPKFFNEANRLAEWKSMLGYKTYVVSDSLWTIDSVKNYIRLYATKHPNMYYLLIIGDFEDVPAKIGVDLWNDDIFVSDYGYACLDSDKLADIRFGRIPVSDSSQAAVVIDKIINYEKNPVLDSSYYQYGINASYFEINSSDNTKECRAFIKTSENCRRMMVDKGKSVQRIYYAHANSYPQKLSDGTPLTADLQKPNYNWDGSGTQISNAIMNGAFYLFHRDHGSSNSWSSPNYTIAHIKALNNGSKLPIVFSINCSTGRFDVNECFAEAFIRKEGGGCVSILCAGGESPSTYNDELSNGIFEALARQIEQPFDHTIGMGDLLALGLSYMQSVKGLTTTSKYEREIYTCFGDPSMIVHTHDPVSPKDVELNLEANPYISTSSENIRIVIYNRDTKEVEIHDGQYVPLDNYINKNVSIGLVGTGYLPLVISYTANHTITIQNEVINSNRYYTAGNIKIGSHVDDNSVFGDVIINNSVVKLKGAVSIDTEVCINKDGELFVEP